MTATMVYLSVHREVSGFQGGNDLPRRQSGGYQQISATTVAESTDYDGLAGQFGPGPGSEADWFRDDRAGPDDAAAIREAAERDAAAIRETAEQEAAQLRARLDMLLGDLGRVVADYVTETLGTPELPAPPARQGIEQARPAATSAMPKPAPARPKAKAGLPGAPAAGATAMPPPPDTSPGTRSARPTAAGPRTAGPRTTGPRTTPPRTQAKPSGKPMSKELRAGRQKNAMRFAKWGTAGLLTFALASAGVMIADHGYGFFVFRENGQGDTPNPGPGRVGSLETDKSFLAQQATAKAKAAQHAPAGRHAKTSPSTKGTTATSTTGG